MKKILFSLALFILLPYATSAQEYNPIDELSKRLYENEMLSIRFLRDFALAKANIFKNKILNDFDQSLAHFDDNISYITTHLPKNKKIRENAIKMQEQWNIFRMAIIDLSHTNYKRLTDISIKGDKKLKTFRKDILNEHPKYDDNKSIFKHINQVSENIKEMNKVIVNYVFKNQLNFSKIEKSVNVDFSLIRKNLKKLAKEKIADKRTFTDLNNSLNMIENIYKNNPNNPKLLYTNTKYFTKKNYLLFYNLISQLQN